MFSKSSMRTSFFALALASALAAVPAAAAPLKLTFTGAINGSYVVDSNPVPNFVNEPFVADIAASTGTGDFTGIAETRLVAPFLPWNLTTSLGQYFTGPQLYSGTLSAPVISTGTFSMANWFTGDPVTLNITAAAAPGAPAPELGASWVAAVAAGIALAITRKRKPALAA